jgi:hypothetical protein
MNVLVACEFSGVVRDAFIATGHNAYSCDLLSSESPLGPHYQDDALKIASRGGWGLMIAHPPCTRLAVAGARWFKGKEKEQAEAIEFCERLWESDIPRICIENPIGVLSTRSKLGKPTQIIQPWMFGHGETKATCLWLKGLPLLVPTNIVTGRVPRVHYASPGPDRWKERSRTLTGIADAMAAQWGKTE